MIDINGFIMILMWIELILIGMRFYLVGREIKYINDRIVILETTLKNAYLAMEKSKKDYDMKN